MSIICSCHSTWLNDPSRVCLHSSADVSCTTRWRALPLCRIINQHHHPYNHKHEKVEIYTQITLPSLTLSCFVVRATSTHRIIIALLTFIVTFTANVIPYEQSVSVFSATSVPSWECRVSLSTLPYLTFNYWSTQGASTHPLIILSASQFYPEGVNSSAYGFHRFGVATCCSATRWGAFIFRPCLWPPRHSPARFSEVCHGISLVPFRISVSPFSFGRIAFLHWSNSLNG